MYSIPFWSAGCVNADLLSSSMNHNADAGQQQQQQQQVRRHHGHGPMSHHQHHYFGAAAKSLNFPSVHHPHHQSAAGAALGVQHSHHFAVSSPHHHQTYIKQETSATNHLNAFYDNFVSMTGGSAPHQTLTTKLA
jgi:hypothetical protein